MSRERWRGLDSYTVSEGAPRKRGARGAKKLRLDWRREIDRVERAEEMLEAAAFSYH